MTALKIVARHDYGLRVDFGVNGWVAVQLMKGPEAVAGVSGSALLHGDGELNMIGCLNVASRVTVKRAVEKGLVDPRRAYGD